MGPPCIWSPSASVRLPKPAPPLAWCTRRCAHGIPSTSVCLSEAAPQQLVQLLCPSSARTRPAARSVHLPESFSRARLFLLGLSILRHAQEAERARRMRRRGHGGGAPAGDRHRGAPLAFYPPSSDVFLGTLQPGAAARPAHGDDPVYDGCDDDGLIDAGAGHGFHAHPAVRGCLSAQSFMSVRPPTGRSACPLSVCPSGLAWRADVWCGEGAAGVWLSGRWVPRAQEGGGLLCTGHRGIPGFDRTWGLVCLMPATLVSRCPMVPVCWWCAAVRLAGLSIDLGAQTITIRVHNALEEEIQVFAAP
jgi:hypothetical protein